MSLKLIFKPAAQTELEEAAAWYENQRQGLGHEFYLEFTIALDSAMANPEIFRRVRGRARRIRLRRFKDYAIYFAVKEGAFVVLSIFHGARDPAELERRLN